MAEAGWKPKLGYVSSIGTSSTAASSADSANYRAGVEVNQLLYDFGATDNQILAAKAVRQQREAEIADTRERIALAASEAYLELVRAEDLTAAADRYLMALVNLRTTISLRTDSGVANVADVHMAETRVQSARGERARSQTRSVASRARLLQLTGEHVARASPPDRLIDAVKSAIQATSDDAGRGMIAAERAAAAARAKLKIAEVSLYPSIGARAGYTHPFGDRDLKPATSVGITVKGDLFNGGASAGRTQAATAEMQAAERNVELTRLTNATDVTVAAAEQAGAAERKSASGRQLESANKARQTSLEEYGIGRRTLTDVLNAEQEILRAETDRINAGADAAVAILRAGAARQVLVRVLADAVP